MQVIWSRAAQTSSCGCNACFNSATKLARRTTTVASKRQLRASDLFTLCYSAMFATAAVVDAKRKGGRRKQWDRAIEEAKAGSSSGSVNEPTATLEWAMKESRMNSPASHRTSGPVATNTFDASEQRASSTESLPQVLDGLRWDLSQTNKDNSLDTKLRVINAHTRGSFVSNRVWDEGIEQSADGKVPAALYSTLHKWRFSPREPTTRTHLDRMENMVSNLVQKLVCATKSFSLDTAGSEHLSLENVIDRRPNFASLSDQMKEDQNTLNFLIKVVFLEHFSNSSSIDMIVAKVCYLLLTSNTPPNVTTYRVMLTHFTRLRQHRHARAVVDSFFYGSQFKPDSRTVSAILDHYTAAGDKAGFQHMIKRMRAMEGDMRIMRLHVSNITEPETQEWAQRWKATHHNNFLYAKVHRDSRIFESLICGVMRFFSINWAMIYLHFAFQGGCHLNIDLIIRLARRCLREENKHAAVKMLSAFVSRWQQQQDNGHPTLESHPGFRKYIYQLLGLCGIQPSKAFQSHESLPRGFRNIRATRSWICCLRAESIGRELAELTETASNLEFMVSEYLSGYFGRQLILPHVRRHVNEGPFGDALRKRYRAILKAHARYACMSESLLRHAIKLVYAVLPVHDQQIYDGLMKGEPSLDTAEKLKIIVDLRLDRCDTYYRSLASKEDPRKRSHSTVEAKGHNPPCLPKDFGVQVYVPQSEVPWLENKWPVCLSNHRVVLPHSRSHPLLDPFITPRVST